MTQMTSLIYVPCDFWDETQLTGCSSAPRGFGSFTVCGCKNTTGNTWTYAGAKWELGNIKCLFLKCLCAEKAALTPSFPSSVGKEFLKMLHPRCCFLNTQIILKIILKISFCSLKQLPPWWVHLSGQGLRAAGLPLYCPQGSLVI